MNVSLFQSYPEILKLLLDKGANKESEDDFGITPLFIAAQYGQLECLRILISYGTFFSFFKWIEWHESWVRVSPSCWQMEHCLSALADEGRIMG